MSDKSAIEWTDATWNPVTGCTRVSPGCAHCYIERTPPFRIGGRRFATTNGASTTGVLLHADRLNVPIRWQKPRRVFVCSLADIFHEDVPDYFLDAIFGVMAATRLRGIDGHPGHTFQVLTKRPERAQEYLAAPGRLERMARAGAARFEDGDNVFDLILDAWPIPNVWVGVSIENARYTWRADVLREIPAAVRFISAEPLLGSLYPKNASIPDESTVDQPQGLALDAPEGRASTRERAALDLTGIDWIIIGGESGPGARPFHLEHARKIIDNVYSYRAHEHRGYGPPAIFVKQLGAKPVESHPYFDGVASAYSYLELNDRKGGDMDEWPEDLRIREFPLAGRTVSV